MDSNTFTATLNGIEYKKGDIISKQGSYKLILTDLVENVSTYDFTIKKDKPVCYFLRLNEHNYSKDYVKFMWSDANLTATINNKPYRIARQIKEQGTYEAILTDLAGNETKYTFTIDKIALTSEIKNIFDSLDKKVKYSRGNVMVTWEKEKCKSILK